MDELFNLNLTSGLHFDLCKVVSERIFILFPVVRPEVLYEWITEESQSFVVTVLEKDLEVVLLERCCILA